MPIFQILTTLLISSESYRCIYKSHHVKSIVSTMKGYCMNSNASKIYLGVVLMICSIAYSDVEENGMQLSVMSFNIRYGTANDGDNSWPNRKDLVIDMLRQYNPDVLGTQEILDFQVEYLANKMPEYDWVGVGRDTDGTGEMVAVFYKKSMFNLLDHGHFWLSETPAIPGSKSWDTSLTRMVTWLSLQPNGSDDKILLLNTHFDHRGEEARSESAKLIVDIVSSMEDDHSTVIITGDFNAKAETSSPWQTFIDASYKDAWLEVDKPVGPNTTWSAFKASEPGADSRIDWILYKGAHKAQHCETVLYNIDERYPSDHYPVFAVLQLIEVESL